MAAADGAEAVAVMAVVVAAAAVPEAATGVNSSVPVRTSLTRFTSIRN